ncbi:MAG: protein kinase [Planctomycetota bacterium]
MPKLMVENGPDKGRSFSIPAEGPSDAGRDPNAQVPLRDDMVSRRHFQIVGRSGAFFIRDLGSSNGTLLNGTVLDKEARLAPNDRIEAGETRLTFVDEQPHPLLGKEVAGYRILDRVGRGGMGTVYRALQTSLDRVVALKILAPHLVKNSSFINLFIREARAAGALSHPNIVQVYDVGVQDDVYFFSMEYIPDGSVEDVMNKEKLISLGRALRIVRDAARGLEYAESKGIIHRDIKPGNLMVGQGQVVKIGDLGIARSTGGESTVSQKDGVSGSPHYIAPEQAQGKDIDHRVDLYALGISFYQMLCGKTPFAGGTPREVILKHIKENPQPIAERVPGLPSEVATLIHELIAKNPAQRVPSASALLARLAPMIDRYNTEGSPEDGPRSIPWRKITRSLAIIAVLGVTGGTAAYLYTGWRRAQFEQQQRETEWRRALTSAEERLAAGEIELARAEQARLGDRDGWPEELIARYAQLDQGIAQALEEARRRARESNAADRLVEITARLKPEQREQDITALRALVRDHPDTAAAREATAVADRLEQELRDAAAFVRSSEEHLRTILDSAETFRSLGRYAKARDELLRFDAKYAGTAAARDCTEALRQLEQLVESRWQEVRNQMDAHLARSSTVEALEAARRFRADVGFPSVVQKIDDEIARIEELERNEDASTIPAAQRSSSALSKALLAAWQELRAEFRVSRALEQLQGFRLDSALLPADQERRERHRRFLANDLPDVLATLLQNSAPNGTEILITAQGRERRVRLTRITDERIDFDELESRGRSKPSFCFWPELTDASRGAVLLASARTPRERLVAGFLACINAEIDLGLGAMEQAAREDATLAEERDHLREVLEWVSRHAGA